MPHTYPDSNGASRELLALLCLCSSFSQDELNRKWKPNSEFYKVFILELWSLKEFNFVTATDDQLWLAYATTILAASVFMDMYNCYIKHATAQAVLLRTTGMPRATHLTPSNRTSSSSSCTACSDGEYAAKTLE